MLLHASLTASGRIYAPLAISWVPLGAYNLVMGAAVWAVVVANRLRAAAALTADGST